MPRLYYSVALLMVLVSGCGSLNYKPSKGPGWYLVKPTDTLYSIAWRYGLDYQDLVLWNGLSEPYIIQPGQQLVLLKPDKLPSQYVPDKVVVEKTSAGGSVTVKTLAPAYNESIRWRWPTRGKLLKRFSINDLDRHGIDIAGEIGQPVYAVAQGKVVYSGKGLAGYGNLIIVKHNNTYLSAYAYNRKRLVEENETVKRGDLIAEMGQDKESAAVLHFQIRKNGKPVDPLQYLPEIE